MTFCGVIFFTACNDSDFKGSSEARKAKASTLPKVGNSGSQNPQTGGENARIDQTIPIDIKIATGAVIPFNLPSCPEGWSRVAAGRTFVALADGGASGVEVGTALKNQENRACGAHTHGIVDPGHIHGNVHKGASPTQVWDGYDNNRIGYYHGYNVNAAVTGVTITESGTVDGTNVPYVQLSICQKN